MFDFINNITKVNRRLSDLERNLITENFPNSILKNIKFLGNEFMAIIHKNYICLGAEENCKNTDKKSDVYTKNDNKFLDSLRSEELIAYVCSAPDFRCENLFSFEIKYNCIGFAIGVLTEIDSNQIVIKNGNSPKKAIQNSLNDYKEIYLSDFSMNIFKIIDKLHYVDDITEPIKNNTVAFYFKNNTCMHAARYITDLDMWVSKLGKSILIGHSIEDLKGNKYGNEIYFAEIIGDNNVDMIYHDKTEF